jgi:excisionase family DNA binding protein
MILPTCSTVKLNYIFFKKGNMIEETKFYSPIEVSNILSVKPATIRSWIFKGQLPVKKFGRCVRIQEVVLTRLIEGGLDAVKDEFMLAD